jgi:hypothetical protein
VGRSQTVIAFTAPAVIAFGCGSGTSEPTTVETTTTVASISTEVTTTSSDSFPATEVTTSTEASPTTTGNPTAPLPDAELTGEPFDLAPAPEVFLAVVGVAFDDALNVRAAPGIDQAILAELDPLTADFVASGRARQLPNSIWFEGTTTNGVVGWVSSRFTAQAGLTDDRTSFVVAEFGEIPVADTMEELGTLVADVMASDDPASSIVMSGAPTVADLGEVTYDVVGLSDDSVWGLRLHVFGQPMDSGAGFSLEAVESTAMCVPVRGVTPEGICA